MMLVVVACDVSTERLKISMCGRQVASQTLEGVLEVKSTKNDQFGEDGIRQLLDWVNRGIQLRQKRYKGIFIGNSSVEKPAKERAWPYSDNWKKSAEVGQLVALRSVDLYLIYLLSAAGELNRDEFWQRLFATNGIFDMSPYVELVVPKKTESEGDAINEGNVRDETAGILKILSPREEKVPAALRHRLRASTPSKRSARSSISRASGFGRSRPRRWGTSALPSGRCGCGPWWPHYESLTLPTRGRQPEAI